jgi:arylsulfatase A-like enzyme
MLCAVWSLAASSHAADQPNIVFLFSDDAGYADFGFQDALTGQTTEFQSPNLDILAQQGVRFSNGYVAASVCSPSRAGLMTGQYPQRFGYEFNIANADNANDGMPIDQVMMPERFQELGYTTGVVGKWHLGRELAKQPQNQGADEFFGLWRGSRPYFGIESDVTRKIRDVNGPRDWVNEASFNNIPVDTGGEGRHVTDAFGDEASRFVANHAADVDPFFLYMPFTAPHGPLGTAKQQDVAEFDGTSLTGNRKNTAALVFAMDRAIGNILHRLDDPNDDGDTSDSIADNTIVVFANDNGGPSGGNHINTPLRGTKGNAFEGGTRVPFLIRMPDPDNPGQFLTGDYDRAVSTLDLFPTFVAAAGESMTTHTDGVDLAPFLTGAQTGDPHEALIWRKAGWAIRKGDWKLVKGTSGNPIMLVQLAADGTGENTDLSAQEPEKYQELLRDFTEWETQMQKPSQTTSRSQNRFDHFVYRHDQSASANWSAADIWQQGGTSNNQTMIDEDAYANAILEFRPRDDASYTATNNMTRSSTLTYMLNELRLDGDFAGASDQSATIAGNDLLLVDNLQGQGPTIRLDSTTSTAAEFTYNIDTNLVLYDNLTIAGDSGQAFVIGGGFSNFYEARSVTKTGVSSVTLTGVSSIGGSLTTQEGEVVLAAGLLAVGELDNTAGGTFSFIGGKLQTPSVLGNLVNNGGTLAPGNSPGITAVSGDYTQSAGTLEIEIEGLLAGTDYDVVQIAGELTAGGTLQVVMGGEYAPQVGQIFEVLTAGTVGGTFLLDAPSDLDGNDIFAIHHNSDSIVLEVLSSFLLVDGDLTFDGLINELDWQVLRPNLNGDTSGLTLGEARQLGDFNADLSVDRSDFVIFKDLFNGANGAGAFDAMVQGVPEPTSCLLLYGAMAAALCARVRSYN